MNKIEFPKKPINFIWYFLKTLSPWLKWATFLTIFLAGIVNASHALMLYGFKLLIEGIPIANQSDVWATLFYPLMIVFWSCFFHFIVYRTIYIIDLYSTPQINNNLRELLFKNVSLHSQNYFNNRFAGELANKISNVNQSFNYLRDRILNSFVPVIFATITNCILLFMIDDSLMLILILAVIFICLLSYFASPYIAVANTRKANTESDISGQLVDAFSNISNIKSYNNHRYELNLLNKVQLPFIAAYRSAEWRFVIFWGLFDIIIIGMIMAFFWYIITRYSSGNFTAGDIAICALIGWDMWGRLSTLASNLMYVSGDLGRMSSALNDFVRELDIKDTENATDFTPKSGEILFNNVSFEYNKERKIFDKFNLVIPPSQRVGVVGLSGAGKTTLCQLLLRNYDINGGVITIGGQNIAAVTQNTLREKIAVIPQDPTLFHRSLRDNIIYGKPDATDEEVIAAAKAAQAHDFIMDTENGYDTLVGERGVKLSGGQRQRITIARAILKNAPILILDEATSALDSDTEHHIQSALDKAMNGRTTIVIAHRLSTLAHLDRIIFMKDGKITEDGTLDELIALNGDFAYLWNLQAGGFLPNTL